MKKLALLFALVAFLGTSTAIAVTELSGTNIELGGEGDHKDCKKKNWKKCKDSKDKKASCKKDEKSCSKEKAPANGKTCPASSGAKSSCCSKKK